MDTTEKCCKNCEYWNKKYWECEHPYQFANEEGPYMAPPDKVCELYESATE